MVAIRYLGVSIDDLSKIVRVEVAFKNKKYKAFEFDESEVIAFLGQFTDNYVDFKYKGETINMYVFYHKYLDDSFGFVLSDEPPEPVWWDNDSKVV